MYLFLFCCCKFAFLLSLNIKRFNITLTEIRETFLSYSLCEKNSVWYNFQTIINCLVLLTSKLF